MKLLLKPRASLLPAMRAASAASLRADGSCASPSCADDIEDYLLDHGMRESVNMWLQLSPTVEVPIQPLHCKFPLQLPILRCS